MAFWMKVSDELKVTSLVGLTLGFVLFFAWLMGMQNPFGQSVSFFVTYQFAGGIEVGSPVRVSGIKVGKVEKIEFFVPLPNQILSLSEPGSPALTPEQVIAPLKIKVSVKKEAAQGVRKDSRFYINLAGVIGERYIEITPGHFKTPPIAPGDTVIGVDPPRFDQLLSQSFDLAGKLKSLLDENQGDITHSIELLLKLSGSLNKTLTWVDKSNLFKTDFSILIRNLIAVSGSVRKMTEKLHSEEGEKTLNLLHDLLWKLEPLDSHAIRSFFQKEGVKVKLF